MIGMNVVSLFSLAIDCHIMFSAAKFDLGDTVKRYLASHAAQQRYLAVVCVIRFRCVCCMVARSSEI